MSKRLSTLTLFNWGVYSGRVLVDFSLDSTDVNRSAVCLSGETGSGKTTITDAYLALIRPKNADASYNAASNGGVGTHLERRTTVSYVRGDCGKDASRDDVEMRLRPDDVVNSAIVGEFVDSSGSISVCARLMQWFELEGKLRQVWLTSSSAIDVERFNISVGTSELSSKLVSSIFPDAVVYDGVGKYEVAMGQSLGFGSDSYEIGNVTRLLSMVQGEKLPSNVGTLFKDYVLKAVDVRSNVRDCVDTIRHEDVRIHEMELTQKHMSVLDDMAVSWDEFCKHESMREGLGELLESDGDDVSMLDGWRNSVAYAYAQRFFDDYENEVKVTEELLTTRTAEAAARDAMFQTLNEELIASKDAAASRLENKIAAARSNVDEKRSLCALAQGNVDKADADISSSRSYRDKAVRELGERERERNERVAGLETFVSRAHDFAKFEDPHDLQTWSAMVDAVAAYDAHERADLQSKCDDLYADIRDIKTNKISYIKAEIADMESRKSRIPSRFARARAKLCSMIGLDESELPFVGELFDMKASEERWRLAANAAYGSLALRLLVANEDRASLQRAADKCNFGFKINYDSVNVDDTRIPSFVDGGLASKFEFDESSEFYMYVERMLSNLDHVCVDDIVDADTSTRTRYVSLTGQIANGSRGSFGMSRESSDIIGFENATRLEDLRSELEDYESDILSMENSRKSIRAKLKDFDDRAECARGLRSMSWEQMFDVSALEVKISELSDEIADFDTKLDELVVERDKFISQRDAADSALALANEGLKNLLDEQARLLSEDDSELSARVMEAKAAYEAAVSAREETSKALSALLARRDAEESVLARRAAKSRRVLSHKAYLSFVEFLDSYFKLHEPFGGGEPSSMSSVDGYLAGVCSTVSSELEVLDAMLARDIEHYTYLESGLQSFEDGYDWRYESVTGNAWADVRSRHKELGIDELSDTEPSNHVKLSWLGYYEAEHDALHHEWHDLDMTASLKAMCSNSLNSLASLQAKDGSLRRDVASRIRAVNKLLANISLSDMEGHYLEVRGRVERSGESKVLFDKLVSFAQQNVDFSSNVDSIDTGDLRRSLIEFADKLETQTSSSGRCFLDPRDYVRITFTEHKREEAITHSGTGKLSGGEMQQMSACIVGAALLYVMGADAGHGPTYETIVLDEAFVKSDEQHARNTLKVLMRMGFVPIVAMPPTIVMSVSPCLSKMLFVTKTEFGTSVVHETHSLSDCAA